MCIRDRDYAESGNINTDLTALRDLADGALDEVHIARDLYPVSYTHLRAHETVLDLVCRLLLEKKKIRRLTRQLVYSTRT